MGGGGSFLRLTRLVSNGTRSILEIGSILETGIGSTSRTTEPKSNDAVASWCEPRRGRGEERGGVRVPRVYRRQNAEGLVNGAKYTTVVHNEGTALSVPISSRASFFTRRFRVVPVALWGFKRAL